MMQPSESSESLIALKSTLNTQQLQILTIEIDRRRRSTAVAYLLWFLLSWLALHKFYLGRITVGVIYLIAPWLCILVIVSGFAMAESDAAMGTVTLMAGLLGLLVYGIWWLVDLFTIPGQVMAYNENLEFEIITSLKAREER